MTFFFLLANNKIQGKHKETQNKTVKPVSQNFSFNIVTFKSKNCGPTSPQKLFYIVTCKSKNCQSNKVKRENKSKRFEGGTHTILPLSLTSVFSIIKFSVWFLVNSYFCFYFQFYVLGSLWWDYRWDNSPDKRVPLKYPLQWFYTKTPCQGLMAIFFHWSTFRRRYYL